MIDDPAAIVERCYDERAEAFAARWFGAQVEPLTSRFVNGLAPRARVIDLGCGPGRDLVRLEAQGIQAFGLDRSAGMLGEACLRRVFSPLVRADFRQIPFPDNSLDGVWACASFLHVRREDMASALAECRRVLKPDGLLALAIKEGSGEQWEDRDGAPVFFAFYRADELTRALRRCGFRPTTWWRQNDSAGRARAWINVLARVVADGEKAGKQEAGRVEKGDGDVPGTRNRM